MLLKSLLSAACMLGALAGTGPAVLYSRLNGLTFNPPGYTIVMYQSCMQNQNAGNPCGSFSTFESANGVYTTQLYGPEAPVSSSCSRTFRLAVACGATMSMSGVNENPTCVYSATLTLPEACGIDMTVGNEAASASGTVAPPTPSVSASVSVSPTSSPQPTVCVRMAPSGVVDNGNAGLSSGGYEIDHILNDPPPVGPLPQNPYWNPGPQSLYRLTLSFVQPNPVYYCSYWGATTATHSPTGISFYTAPAGTLLYASASTTSSMRDESYTFPFQSTPNVSSIYTMIYKSTSFQARTYYLACYTCMLATMAMAQSVTPSAIPSVTESLAVSSTWTSVPSPSWTSTPLFAMTAYPSRAATPSMAVTTTPLFMVTAFPTPSPVNVSAAAADSTGPASSSTATILGAVAVGVLGILLIAGAIIYFRNGGTLGGLVNKIKENKETIQKIAGNVTNALPISDEQKKAITGALADPLSVLPAEAQKIAGQAVAAAGQVAAVAGKAQELKSQAIDALPISDEQKAMLTAAIDAKLAEAMKRIESTPVGVHVKSLVEVAPAVPEPPAAAPPEPPKPEPPAAAPPEPPAAEPTLVTVNISTEELASLREFMASKQASKD